MAQEPLVFGGMLAIIVEAPKPYAEYDEADRHRLAKHMIGNAISRNWPTPLHLRLLIEYHDKATGVYFQTWFVAADEDLRFNGTDEPEPLFIG